MVGEGQISSPISNELIYNIHFLICGAANFKIFYIIVS